MAMCLSFCSCAQQKSDKMVSVAFYNVENLFDTLNDPLKDDDEFTPKGKNGYTQAIYQQKLENLATVISQLGAEAKYGPALIGLAEIENDRVLRDLVSRPEIKKRNYQFIWFDGPDPRGIDVALLYHPKLFNPLKVTSSVVDLIGTGDKELTRDILYVTGTLANDTVHILINHWPSRRDGKYESGPKRTIAALANRKVIDSLLARNKNSKIIVMGDFNDDPKDASITTILRGKGKKSELQPKDLYNPWLALYNNGAGTLTYQRKWNLFDQIIISPSILDKNSGHLYFSKAQVFAPEFIRWHSGKNKGFPYRGYTGGRWQNGFSDHFPVEMYFSVN